jgi:acyl-CoA reductase-like NAD-dependent aldehyde dehydrogenase
MSVFGNAGQDCCARSRILVERPVYDEFLEAFTAPPTPSWWATRSTPAPRWAR